jgi:Domain of unknown function (DUF4386)
VATTIESANLLNCYAPPFFLEGGNASVFKPEQLHAFAYMSLALHAIGFDVALVFSAFYDLLIGYLVFRWGFLPRILGVRSRVCVTWLVAWQAFYPLGSLPTCCHTF